MQVQGEDDIFYQAGKKRISSAEKKLKPPSALKKSSTPSTSPKINLYSDVLKKGSFAAKWKAPEESVHIEEPAKGYTVHRRKYTQPSVNKQSPSEAHSKSVNKLLYCTDVYSAKSFLVDTGASVSILD